MISPLRQARLMRGVSLTRVAKDLGCSVAHLSCVETGQATASPDFAERLAKYFENQALNELHILYPERGLPPSSAEEELELLACYRRMREEQKILFSKLANFISRQATRSNAEGVLK